MELCLKTTNVSEYNSELTDATLSCSEMLGTSEIGNVESGAKAANEEFFHISESLMSAKVSAAN
jgi:hypothetical protein